MKHKIAVLSGDGIGPEVMEQALKVLDKISKLYNFEYEIKEALIGGCAIDKFGTPFPDTTKEICLNSDAVLLGSIGGPKWDNLPPEKKPEIGGLLALRKMLKLYANIRPVILFNELKYISPLKLNNNSKIDLVTVRELASGIYFGQPKLLNDDKAYDTMVYQKKEIEKIARIAFELARQRNKKVISVDKANVLYSSMLWRKTVAEVSQDYPDIEVSNMYVDNAAMQLILNPLQFDVILTSNLFGDILSDESAAIAGSLGMLPSASLSDDKNLPHLFEPAGGSAPDIAGKNIANPIAQILSVALLCFYSLDQKDAYKSIFNAVSQVIKEGFRTKDIYSDSFEGLRLVSTKEMGKEIINRLS